MIQPEKVLIDHQLNDHRNFFIVNWFLENQYNIQSKSGSQAAGKDSEGFGKYLDRKVIKNFAEQVIRHYQKPGRTIVFEFTGGELTSANYFLNILSDIKDFGCKTGVIAGLIRKPAYWEKLIAAMDFVTLKFIAGYCQPDQLEAAIIFFQERVPVRINLLMDRKFFEECRNLGERIMKEFPRAQVSVQFQKNLTRHDYTPNELESIRGLQEKSKEQSLASNLHWTWPRGFMRNYYGDGHHSDYRPEQYITDGENQWQGWMCWSGLEEIVVSPEGEVFRAGCYRERLGDVWSELEFPLVPISCSGLDCRIPHDVAVKRQKQLYFNPKQIPDLAKLGFFN